MRRGICFRSLIALALFVPVATLADAYSDLVKSQTAFQQAKSWHAEEHFSNGKTVTVDFSAPDSWRIQPMPNITELLIGNDVYMVRNGKATHVQIPGSMLRKTISGLSFATDDEVKQSARDLGMQTLDGKSVHVYSYTSRGTPATIYIGPDLLPVQLVVNSKKGVTTVNYSKYNVPITLKP